jgi:peptidoglycan/xylan/chitin deacetylase (PgdA/CDA1 family)
VFNLDRRTLLRGIAVGVLAAADALAAGGGAGQALAVPKAGRSSAPDGVLTRLPGDGNLLAFTVDDGTSSEVVAAFADFCRDTGTRITFFVNGVNKSWTVNAPALRPMVDSGQIQLANHTWSHPYITKIGADEVANQITRNTDFLVNTYAVDGRPFFRPPYGRHTDETDRIASDLGYHTITMWSGSLGDSSPLTADELVANAATAFQPQQIVLAHANKPTVTHCYGQLVDIIRSRNLQTVTLNDVFS